jgi:hypothetical protein
MLEAVDSWYMLIFVTSVQYMLLLLLDTGTTKCACTIKDRKESYVSVVILNRRESSSSYFRDLCY